MDAKKKAKLEATGWKIGSAEEFLGLSKAESEYIKIKVALAKGLREKREKQGLTQVRLAKRANTSQSRLAKMEAGEGHVSLDLMIKALLTAGADGREVAAIITSGVSSKTAKKSQSVKPVKKIKAH